MRVPAVQRRPGLAQRDLVVVRRVEDVEEDLDLARRRRAARRRLEPRGDGRPREVAAGVVEDVLDGRHVRE